MRNIYIFCKWGLFTEGVSRTRRCHDKRNKKRAQCWHELTDTSSISIQNVVQDLKRETNLSNPHLQPLTLESLNIQLTVHEEQGHCHFKLLNMTSLIWSIPISDIGWMGGSSSCTEGTKLAGSLLYSSVKCKRIYKIKECYYICRIIHIDIKYRYVDTWDSGIKKGLIYYCLVYSCALVAIQIRHKISQYINHFWKINAYLKKKGIRFGGIKPHQTLCWRKLEDGSPWSWGQCKIQLPILKSPWHKLVLLMPNTWMEKYQSNSWITQNEFWASAKRDCSYSKIINGFC